MLGHLASALTLSTGESSPWRVLLLIADVNYSEVARFIANGRLHARIDRVNGIVETTRPSLKNAQYETVVRQGDVLLNEVQRLSKVLY